MDALGIFELTAKAGRAYVCAIRQAYRDALAGDPENDYYASRLGRAEEGGEALEPRLWGCNRCDGPLRPADQLPGGLCPSCVEYYDDQIEDALAEELAAPQVPSSSAGRGVGSPGVSAGAEEPAPPGKRPTPGEFAAVAVREVLAEHHPWEGAGGIECSPESADFEHPYSADHLLHFADKYDWREHVATEIQRRIDAAVGATPTPKPADVPEKFEHWFQK